MSSLTETEMNVFPGGNVWPGDGRQILKYEVNITAEGGYCIMDVRWS
jgi:hypothetical protein